MKKNVYTVLLILTSFLIWGCSKECIEPVDEPSFSTDIQPIFSAGCSISGCHDTQTVSGGLDLSEEQSYSQLVDVASGLEPDKFRVVPGDAQNSYLVIKLEGRQSSGEAMPLGGSLDDTDLDLIRTWIDNGAEDN